MFSLLSVIILWLFRSFHYLKSCYDGPDLANDNHLEQQLSDAQPDGLARDLVIPVQETSYYCCPAAKEHSKHKHIARLGTLKLKYALFVHIEESLDHTDF